MLAVVAGDCEADDSCVFIQFLHFPLNWQHRVILNVPTSYLGPTPTRKAKDTPPPRHRVLWPACYVPREQLHTPGLSACD